MKWIISVVILASSFPAFADPACAEKFASAPYCMTFGTADAFCNESEKEMQSAQECLDAAFKGHDVTPEMRKFASSLCLIGDVYSSREKMNRSNCD